MSSQVILSQPSILPTPQSAESSHMHLLTVYANYGLAAGHCTGLPLLCSQSGKAQTCAKLRQPGSSQLSSIPLRYLRDPRNESCEGWPTPAMSHSWFREPSGSLCTLERFRGVTGLSSVSDFHMIRVASCDVQCAAELEEPRARGMATCSYR